METESKTTLRRISDKLFGGLRMSWPAVILFALGAAVLTAVFLIVPVFEKTSFYRMGVQFEAWILFAVIIMSNCQKPIESALKTFVFFLVSQPLIYVFQVPFSPMGWGLLQYYRYWFLCTLLTFPMAFVGWYIKRKNWLSLLILSPVLFYLAYTSVFCFRFTLHHFPLRLVTAVFCLLQFLLYLYAFTANRWQKLTGLLVPVAAAVVILLATPRVSLETTAFIPGDPVLTEAAQIQVDNSSLASVSVASTGADSMLRIRANDFGSAALTIRDGGKTYRYALEIYEDDSGSPQIILKPVQ